MCCKPDVDAECDWLCKLVTITDSITFVYVFAYSNCYLNPVFFRNDVPYGHSEFDNLSIANCYRWCNSDDNFYPDVIPFSISNT